MLQGSKTGQLEDWEGLRAHPVQHIGQMGGQSGHSVYSGFKGASGGPLVGHEDGPQTVEDGADEDQSRGIGTDPEELEDSPGLGRGQGESGKNLPRPAKHLCALEKMDEAVGRRAAAERTHTTNSPTGRSEVPGIAC